MEDLLDRILDGTELVEFQPDYAPEFLCAAGSLNGRHIAVIANRRGFLKTKTGPRIGGIVYTESARKVAYFVENAQRHNLPILYVQDVSGFMVGVEAETAGIIRAGAEMVETMACATVPKIVLTVNHASGAGYYAMAGQGFDPNFTFSWPSARIGVMEGESAVQAVHGPELEKYKAAGQAVPAELTAQIEKTRADYERLAGCQVRGRARTLRCADRSGGYQEGSQSGVRRGLLLRLTPNTFRFSWWSLREGKNCDGHIGA